MAASTRLFGAVGAIVLLGVAFGGCITVFPAQTIVTTDPRASSMSYLPVIAYEHEENPSPGTCPAGTDTRTIFVPQLTRSVTVDFHGFMTSVGEPFASSDPRHIDLTVADGEGTEWVDIHLRNNATDKKLTIEGPRPGGWTVTLSWQICNGDVVFVKADDEFRVLVVVTQPA